MTVTFSMVAIIRIARVMRCSRVTNISRYGIFNYLPKSNTTFFFRFPELLASGAVKEIVCEAFNVFVGSTVKASVGHLSCF